MAVYRPTYRDQKTGELKQSRKSGGTTSVSPAGASRNPANRRARRSHAEPRRSGAWNWSAASTQSRITGRSASARVARSPMSSWTPTSCATRSPTTFAEYALGHLKRLVGNDGGRHHGRRGEGLPDGAAQGKGRAEVDQRRSRVSAAYAGRAGRLSSREAAPQNALKLAVGGSPRRSRPRQKAALLARSEGAALAGDLSGADAGPARRDAGRRDPRPSVGPRRPARGAIVTVGDSKTEAGEGRTIPLNCGRAGRARRAFQVVSEEVRRDPAGVVRVPVRQTAADRPDAAGDAASRPFGRTMKTDGGRHRPLARQPAHVHHGPG